MIFVLIIISSVEKSTPIMLLSMFKGEKTFKEVDLLVQVYTHETHNVLRGELIHGSDTCKKA